VAQAPTTPTAPTTTAPVRRTPGSAYPQRAPVDPAIVERGKAIYGVQCNFCHGSDARGGEGGPNLLRSELVLKDENGELIAPVVRNGREGMPKFDLPMEQIAAIAAFIHSFRVGGYDISRQRPPSIVVGDPKAGETYFNRVCSSCHSVTGNLKGIASRITDPKRLQQTWLAPRGGRRSGGQPGTATAVTVTLTAGGKVEGALTRIKVEGALTRIDDFEVTLTDAEGAQHTFTREGDSPKVEIHDPLLPHKQLLPTYTDKDIHDVTAYLETVK
jgi:mono/diheme cytochrome c family protein